MAKAVYPGTFDPITFGHLDVIQRSSVLFEEVHVVVSHNLSKKTLFSAEERLELIRECVSGLKNVILAVYKGLTVDYLKSVGAQVLIRGLRAVSDFEFEFQMAMMNKKLQPKCETMYLMPGENYTYLNSSIVKEIAVLGGRVSEFVPKNVERELKRKIES